MSAREITIDVTVQWKDPVARAQCDATELVDNPAGQVALDKLPPEYSD